MSVPWIFTFYSFKGGVGRSLAAANVAYTLAGWGRHVLLVDMDLEAPGVSGFLDRAGELVSPAAARQNDILTLLGEFVDAIRKGATDTDTVRDLQPVSGYIRRVASKKLEPMAPKMGEPGRLDVLGIDQGRNYSERLASLGLHGLDHDSLLRVSSLLRTYLKNQRFLHRPFWFESFQESVSTPYDYVIVDSRTGLTEIGGLCVGPLADRLVVVTGLNDQNIEGTRLFLEEVGIKPEARPKNHEPWDEADEPENESEAGSALGPKPTIIVASPVPAGEIEAKKTRLQTMAQRLGAVPAQVSYHPQMALFESVFVRDFRHEYLASQYIELANRVQWCVRDDEGHLVARLEALLASSEENRSWSGAVQLAMRVAPISAFGRTFVSLLANAIGRREPESAAPIHALLSQEVSTENFALTDWGRALSDQANELKGEYADRLFEAAYSKYEKATKLLPTDAYAVNTWGASLSDQALRKKGPEADQLFAAAYEKYDEAVKAESDNVDALSNWGNALTDQAITKDGELADRLFGEANGKFAEASKLRPGSADVLAKWGDSLVEHASAIKGKDRKEADRLFAMAFEKYAEAVRLVPSSQNALNNWGNALTDQAEMKEGEVAERLFEAAYAKFMEAVRLKPERAAMRNWVSALVAQSKAQPEKADQLFATAYQKYAETVGLRLKPEHPAALSKWIALVDETRSKSVL